MAQGELAPALAGGLLVALRQKGETAEEIRGFARGMRELARRPAIAPGPYVDIVGTGGDGSHSLNLSTGSALLAAACGLPVVKHGNRSVSSRCGSADVLAALGLPIPLDETAAAECLARVGFTFLFAPHYHPAMKHIAPVRQALGVRTVFNVLGPLVNPAAPPFHVIGAFSDSVAALMAETLAGMDITRVFVDPRRRGLGRSDARGPVRLLRRAARPRRASDARLARLRPRAVLARRPARRRRRVERRAREGRARGRRHAGAPRRARARRGARARGHGPRARRARAACSARSPRIESGAARDSRREARRVREGAPAVTFLERMAAASRERVQRARAAESDAKLARRAERTARPPPLELAEFDVIAELKLRSPAAGGLADRDSIAARSSHAYARGGAAAVSVLTEPTEFNGELAHLVDAAALLAPQRRPVMRKDFVTDPYQVLEARAAGAGGVLVIVTMLDDATVRALVDCARELRAVRAARGVRPRGSRAARAVRRARRRRGPPLLAGVNCRDLRDLERPLRAVRGARAASAASTCRPSPRAASAPRTTSRPSRSSAIGSRSSARR